jgi:hypothetical protein
MADALIPVTLCWSVGPRQVQEVPLRVPPGASVQVVLDLAAGQWPSGPGVSDAPTLSSHSFLQAGIWGRKVPWTHRVQAGDRVELYRPLQVDPKGARRQRFKRQGNGRTGLFANRKSGSAAGY